MQYEFVDPAKETGEFTIVATKGEMGMEYVCFQCAALSVPSMIPHYLETNWNNSLDLTADTHKAEWFMKAFIRFDGFTSLEFNQYEQVLQFSFDEFVEKLQSLLNKLAEVHRRLVPS